MAKLRVGWMVAGCAPGVRTITRSVLFHSTTWLAGFGAWAIAGARFAAASTAAVVPARSGFHVRPHSSRCDNARWSTRLKRPATNSDRPSRSVGRSAAASPTETPSPLALFQTEPYLPVARLQCHSAHRSFAVTRNKSSAPPVLSEQGGRSAYR